MTIQQIPRFSALRSSYPTKEAYGTKELLDTIGGSVRRMFRDTVNTCGLRMSWCLNNSGQKIQRLKDIPVFEGVRPPPNPRIHKQLSGDLYVASADHMKAYLDKVFGPGKKIYDARKNPERIAIGGRRDVQGIVVFDWLGAIKDFGATGHVDLFFVRDNGGGSVPQFTPACAGSCYWFDDKQPMVAYLWEARP